MKIEKLELLDLNSLYDLDKNSFPKPWNMEEFEKEILNPNAIVLGIFERLNFINRKKKLLSAILGRIILDEFWIFRIMTHPNYRRQRFAISLIVELVKILTKTKKNCVKSLWLEVNVKNEIAISFYKKNGFKIITKRPMYYPEDALVMCFTLEKSYEFGLSIT